MGGTEDKAAGSSLLAGNVGDGALASFEELCLGVDVFRCGGQAMEANDKEEKEVAEATTEEEGLIKESFEGAGDRRQNRDSIDE